MKTMVRVYSIENCPYCEELKQYLTNEGIEYVDIDVNKPENDAEFNKLYEVTKSEDVPQIKIGQQILVPHVSFTSIREAADLTKKFLV